MTDTRKWTFGTVAVVLLILMASWLLVISPKRSEAASLNVQASEQLSTNQQLQTEAALLKQQYKQLPKMQAKLAALQSRIPEGSQQPSMIAEINSAAVKAGVKVVSFGTTATVAVGAVSSPGTALPAGTLAAMPVNLQVEGGYFELQQFLNEMENIDRVFLVSNLNIVEAQDTTTTDASTTGSTTASSAGALSATIGGRVYLVVPAADTTTVPATVPGMTATTVVPPTDTSTTTP